MPHLTIARRAGQAAAVATIGVAMLTFGVTAAFADTSAATAQAIDLTIGGGSLVTSGTQSASNPGGVGDVTSPAQPPLSILGTQSTLAVGLLAQTAIARGDGTSAACAGLIGAGGTIQIGNDGNCAVVGATTGGVRLDLPNAVTLTATAILEECTASSDGTLTAHSQLVDAQLNLFGKTAVSLPVDPAPGQKVDAFVLSLGLNNVSNPQAGEIKGTALSLSVLNTIGLDIGTVTCGPNAKTAVSSVFPLKSLPIVGGTALVVAAGAALWYRRRQRVTVS